MWLRKAKEMQSDRKETGTGPGSHCKVSRNVGRRCSEKQDGIILNDTVELVWMGRC